MPSERDQLKLIAFLSHADTYGPGIDNVDHMITHISHVFLAGGHAYKLKRAVRLPYVDFSTPALRHKACEQELVLNRRTAPELYERVAAITRKNAGGFEIDGPGEALDWLVVMRRFDQNCLLYDRAVAGSVSAQILRVLADEIARFHSTAEILSAAGGADAIATIIAGNGRSFARLPHGTLDQDSVERLQTRSRRELAAVRTLLDARREQGRVRRCHGDLHLKNICLIDSKPVLFDCIEFSDTLNAIDVLYDLAFLLMDLVHLGLTAEANAVLNRYLDRSGDDGGIPAVRFFMSIRAAIRAHVTVAAQTRGPSLSEGRAYLGLALRLLEHEPPRLVAIGGLSGTGKSTLARQLGPAVGQPPGARILRSDVIRKQLFGLPPETRLGPEGYEEGVTQRVYAAMAATAKDLLKTGVSVIVDAVFARSEERDAIRAVAAAAGAAFQGLWLSAPAAILEERIAARRDDASDANLAVLRRQLGFELGTMDWTEIDVSSTPDAVVATARAQIDQNAG